jgi:hypothetical protein
MTAPEFGRVARQTCLTDANIEECRLLGYRNPVCTSQETHYFSATETSWLMLCNIWSFHGCDAVWFLWEQIFRRNISPPLSG